MGWLYNNHTGGLKDLIAERCRGWSYDRKDGAVVEMKLLARCFRGNPAHQGNLWKLYEKSVTKDGVEVEPAERFIAVDLLKCVGGCWGYKDMDETCGPCEVNCPISYIRRASPTDHCYAAPWRERVIAHYARTTGRKLAVGQWYRLFKNTLRLTRIQLSSLKPLRGTTQYGVDVKLKRSLLAETIPQDQIAQQLLAQIEDGDEEAEVVYKDRVLELGLEYLYKTIE